MKIHPFARMAALGLILLALGTAAAFAGPEKARSGLPPPNLAIGVDAPGALRAEVRVYVPELKEPLRYDLTTMDGGFAGGVYIPPGKDRRISIAAFDANREALYKGESVASIEEGLTREISIRLEGRESDRPLEAKLGTYLLELGFGTSEGKGFLLQATVFDAFGRHIPFKPDDIQWGLPKEFEILPYSCFRNSLCIELPDPKVYADMIACFRDFTCWNRPPKDTRGPYLHVAVGLNHTCALTRTSEIRCWGDNARGQLGTLTASCSITGRSCSLVPVPVVCPAGEVCRFIALSAGGDHTCAVDTGGKTWCWGDTDYGATGPAGGQYGSPEHLHVPVESSGVAVSLFAIDTNIRGTCGLSTAREVFCWGSINGLPVVPGTVGEVPRKVPGTKKYVSVDVGLSHTCVVEQWSGEMNCFGSNYDFQISGALTLNPNQNLIVNPLVPLLGKRGVSNAAAGGTSSCAQNWDADLICWGSDVTGSLMTTSGFVALRRAYANSVATDVDLCGAAFGSGVGCGTRTCLTGISGELFCGKWVGGTHPQLTEIPDPTSDGVVIWNQVDQGPNHACAVNTQQDVWCWGLNTVGQFGTGVASGTRIEEPVTAAQRVF
jgi:alpha-tubulin suppressor-like RCC1 family protein